MNSQLFAIDPMAASSYGLYNSIKKEEGSFVDFLLSYDSKAANESDNSWLTDLISADNIKNITSPEVLQTLATSGFSTEDIFSQRTQLSDITAFYTLSTMDLLSGKSAFDTQVEGYKLLLKKEMELRNMPVPNELYM